MSRVSSINGRYLRHRRACVHIADRGNQFANGDGYRLLEPTFAVAAANCAGKRFFNGTTAKLLPVVSVCGDKIADSPPRPVGRRRPEFPPAHLGAV